MRIKMGDLLKVDREMAAHEKGRANTAIIVTDS